MDGDAKRIEKSNAERMAAFGRAIEALRREVESDLGSEDAAHAQRIDKLSRRLEVLGRGLIHVSFEPVGFGVGMLALWLHKSLELMELGHMALHGAYDGVAGAERLQADRFVWKAPIDEASWQHAHNIRHPQFTNIAGKDPDLDFGVFRLSARVGYRRAHALQPLTNSLSWLIFSPAINFHVTGVLARLFKPADGDQAAARPWRTFFAKGLRYYGREFVLYPLLAGPFFPKVLLANLLTEAARDVCAGAIIYCGHVGASELPSSWTPPTRAHWYAMQAEAARDVEVPEAISILCGALDRQIEHHLFPRLPPNRLRQIAPRVRAICEAHGVRYRSDSWPNALRLVLAELNRLRSPTPQLALE